MLRKISLTRGLADVLAIICLTVPFWHPATPVLTQDFDRFFQLNALRLNPGSNAPEIEILQNTKYDISQLSVSFWTRPAPGTLLDNNVFFVIRNHTDAVIKFRNNELLTQPALEETNLQLTEFTLNSKLGYQKWFQVLLSFSITATGSLHSVSIMTGNLANQLLFSNNFISTDTAFKLYFGIEDPVADPNLVSTT